MVSPVVHAIAVASLAAAFISSAILIYDLLRHPQKMWIMNLVWPVTALYFGPIAAWAYYAMGRSAANDSQAHAEKPFWQIAFVGTTHCGAGCTLGDIIAEFAIFFATISVAGSVLGAEYIGDYVLAYFLGIAFQYFAIVPMRHLTPGKGLWAAIKADTLSLTAFEVGLFGWMWLMQIMFRPHLHPNELAYWFMMQIGMVIGFITSYPMTWYLLRRGIKEPM